MPEDERGIGRLTRMHLPTAATVVMVGCVLATGCTSTTGTTPATPAGTEVVTAELADGTWQGTFQVDGQLTNAPAHVGSAGCTAIGRMALDLHQGPTSTHRRVSGRLRVWAVTMSGTTGSACGRRDRSRGSLLGTLASDGTHLRADRFRLLGVPYGWLTANITTFPVTPTMQLQQLQGRFGAGRSHHRLVPAQPVWAQVTWKPRTSAVRAMQVSPCLRERIDATGRLRSPASTA